MATFSLKCSPMLCETVLKEAPHLLLEFSDV